MGINPLLLIDGYKADHRRQYPAGTTLVYDRLICKGFEPTVVLGIGSYTYQHVTRDTFGFAMKATYGEIGGSPREIFKSPKTDPSGEKKSAKGLLQVVADGDSLKLRDQATKDDLSSSLLQPVFRDGAILKRCSFKDVRNTLWPLGF